MFLALSLPKKEVLFIENLFIKNFKEREKDAGERRVASMDLPILWGGNQGRFHMGEEV